jgi:hypothetical protein
MHNGEPEEEKSRNVGPKPITSNTKEVVQRDKLKTWKDLNPSPVTHTYLLTYNLASLSGPNSARARALNPSPVTRKKLCKEMS